MTDLQVFEMNPQLNFPISDKTIVSSSIVHFQEFPFSYLLKIDNFPVSNGIQLKCCSTICCELCYRVEFINSKL